MAIHRPARVAEQIHRILAEILREEAKDPRVRGASVTEVRVTADLSIARVWVSPLGGLGSEADLLEGLERARGFLRSRLARELRIRRCPELDFRIEDHLDEAIRLTARLERMARAWSAQEEE